MNRRRMEVMASVLLITGYCASTGPSRTPALPQGSQQVVSQAPATAPGVIKAEANLVLLDVVATDKKGNYVRDLESKDFHVYEDNSEQKIISFSRASDANGPNAPSQKRYLVLFFDDSTMDTADQARARQAAAQFIDKSASPDR